MVSLEFFIDIILPIAL